MGLIQDSTVFIAGERQGLSVRRTLTEMGSRFAGERFALSVVSVMELAHGVARAGTPQRMTSRRQYLLDLVTALPVHPVTIPIAPRAGQIDGENTAKGVRLAISDLLIGVTALEHGYKVATANLRHFQMVPGLEIVSV